MNHGRQARIYQPPLLKSLNLRPQVSKNNTDCEVAVSQISNIVSTLKKSLRQQGLTYADVAKALDLSEASIKRLFAEKSFTLKRLEQISRLAHLELSDLIEQAEQSDRYIEQLSEQQEQALVEETKLLMVAYLLFSHWSFPDIIETYDISETQGIQYLAKLDRLKIIDLLPNNRVKMHLARNFVWRSNGPIQRFFESQVQNRFFKSSFNRQNELKLVLNGNISESSNQLLQQQLRRVADEFESLKDNDRKLGVRLRAGTTMMLAIRSWELDIFEKYKRKQPF